MARGHDNDDAGNNHFPDEAAGTSGLLDRRSYLRLSGVAAAAGVSTAIGAGSAAAETRNGISFDRVVDATDFGADPSGNASSDGALDQAMGQNTLVRFPEGTYHFTRRHTFRGMGAVGILGEGDVTFTFPGGFNTELAVFRTGSVLIENVDVDHTASNCATGFKLLVDGDFHVKDVEFLGRGVHPDSRVTPCFVAQVHDASATGIIENVTALEGSTWASYKGAGGRIGCHIGPGNAGTIRFVNVHFEEFGNNGIYASASGGPVQVEDSVFRNNNVASVRFGGEGCYVKNTVIENGLETYSGPRTHEGQAFNLRCIVWEQKKAGNASRGGGGVIENCDLRIGNVPSSAAAVHVWQDGPGVTLRNNRIQVDRDGTPHVSAETPDGGPHEVPPRPWSVQLENTSLTGSGGGSAGVVVTDRPDTVVDGCCFQLPGSNCDGVRLRNSGGAEVTDSTINVSGQPVAGSDATTTNLSQDGTCPVPNLDGEPDAEDEGDAGDEEDAGDDELPNRLTIHGDKGKATYEFGVSGDLEKTEADDATIDDHDELDGGAVAGHVWGGRDSYRFSGELTEFRLDGPATVYLNGEEVEPTGLGLHRVLKVESTGGGRAEYSFAVSGNLEAGPEAEHTEGPDGNAASGGVGPERGVDDFRFSGFVTEFDLDGPANVFVDDEQVDPDAVAKPHVLTIDGGKGKATYEVAVSGGLAKTIENDATIDDHDELDGGAVAGHVWGGRDSYRFSGDVTDLQVDGPATVLLDGDEVDPASLG